MTTTTTRTPPPDTDRVPPHNADAERGVIGALMLSKDAIGQVAEIIRDGKGVFYHPGHTALYATAIGMYNRGEPVDKLTLMAAMFDGADAKAFERLGGATYLSECLDACPTAANGAFYARIVHEHAIERRLIDAGFKVTQLGYGGDGRTLAERVDVAGQTIHDLVAGATGPGFTRFDRLLQSTYDEIETIYGLKGQLRGIPTGFVDLDRLTSGLRGGQVVVVAGRPSMGKSTLAAQLAGNAAIKHGIPAAVFSLEMSAVELTMRWLSEHARVPLHVYNSGMLSDDDWAKTARRMGEIAEAPLFVDETVGLTLTEIAAKSRRLVQQEGVRIIVVDQISLIATTGKGETRQIDVATLSRGLKILAKQLNVVMVVVAQLNRGPEGRSDKRPMLSDLRESGQIEADADIVILLHRDDYYDKESPRAGEADFIVAKHRNGPTDTITVAAQLHLCRFVDMSLN